MPDEGDAKQAQEGARPVIEAGARFAGLVVLHGAARIDGAVEGQVIGAECLEIGEGAAVHAEIEAGEVHVAGQVEGAVRATRRIALGPRAWVRGRIQAPAFAAEEGARVDAECRMAAAGSGDPPSHP